MKKEQGNLNYVQMEESVLSFWKENDTFEKVKAKNKNSGKYFATLDGPITANYIMGLHHAYNRTFKDAMIKFASLCGCDEHYQNGFDAHGLPVELRVERELGLDSKKDIEAYGIDRFVEACMSTVDKYSKSQTESSIRLGQWMNWDDSYYTNSDNNITTIWHFLKKCQEKNWIANSHRIMRWCTRCGTSLSDHEMSDDDAYKTVTCLAIFFKCPIKNTNNDMLVWTTTPWTLSANVAIAVNPELDYNIVKIKSSDRNVIVCASAMKVLKDDVVEIIDTVKGSALEGLTYETCFPELNEQNFEHKIVLWDEVSADEGTGAVHIAPGCGDADFELGKSLNLPKICPIDEAGIYYDNFGIFAGKNANTDETRDFVFDKMRERGKLYYTHKYSHNYPHCWRCKNPLLFRLVDQWVIKMDELRPQLISAIDDVEFQPEFMKKRMLDWLTNMGDWAISRSRYYGLPLPFYPCKECGELTIVGSLEEFKKLADPKEVESLPHLHRPYIDNVKINCPHCNSKVDRIKEVGDCWLDAGITPFSTKKYFTDKEFFEKNFPVNCVIEGKEQIRLWFYSLLVMSVVLTGKAPFKKIATTPMLLAQDGKKLSKSSPNNIPLDQAFTEIGADIIRYNFVATPLINDVKFGRDTCDEVKRKLLGLWNAYIFLNTYASIDNPNLTNYTPNENDLTFMDKWLINRINEFTKNTHNAYTHQDFGAVAKDFENLIDELTNWYIRNNRRRFYKSEDNSDTMNAYFCLHYALKNISMVMFPIIPFISEYIWQNAVRELDSSAAESVAIHGFKMNEYTVTDSDLTKKTNIVRDIFTMASKLRNENQIKVKQPLKTMFINGNNDVASAVELYRDIIESELNIKNIVIEHDNSKFNIEFLNLDFRKAGAVLKGDVQKVKNYLTNATDEEMQAMVEGFKSGSVNVGEFTNLASDLFVLSTKAKGDFVIANENDITVVLDVTIDRELMLEGLSRELIRSIQVMRKSANFNVEDRIIIELNTDSEELNEIITKYSDKIKTELLALDITKIDNPDYTENTEIAEDSITIKLKKQ
ncbi:MAG: isoleucine--tRNA ligase [Clostridia bacterium]